MMRIFRFFKLNRADQGLFLRTLFLLWMLQFRLWFLPFRAVRRFSASAASKARENPEWDSLFADRVFWSVRIAARTLPGKRTCLVQALAVRILLARRLIPSELCLGVKKDGAGKLEAHAWVKCRGEILFGGEGLDGYTLLTNSREDPAAPSSGEDAP
jgi:hypothetical protein